MVYFGFLLIVISLMSSNSAMKLKNNRPRHTLSAREIVAPKIRRNNPHHIRLQDGRLDNMAAMKLLELNNVFELADILNSDVRETATVANIRNSNLLESISDAASTNGQKLFADEEDEAVGNYDKNGMIVLSKPKNREYQNVNNLMDKVIKYKLRNNEKSHLRQPFTKVFSRSEIDTLKKIVRAIDEEDVTEKPVPAMPSLEFEFADLVL